MSLLQRNHTSLLLDACDSHYRMMVGKGVREQCKDTSESKADPIPHIGTSLFVTALFKRERFWTETLQLLPTLPAKRLDETKVSKLMH